MSKCSQRTIYSVRSTLRNSTNAFLVFVPEPFAVKEACKYYSVTDRYGVGCLPKALCLSINGGHLRNWKYHFTVIIPSNTPSHLVTMQQNDTEKRISEAGLQRTKSNRIQWNKQHEEYPRNWPIKRKVFDTSIIVFLEFYTYEFCEILMIAYLGLICSKHCNQHDWSKYKPKSTPRWRQADCNCLKAFCSE